MASVQESSEKRAPLGRSEADKSSAEVTYIPDEGGGDPNKVTWSGIEFRANVPVSVPLTHGYSAPIRKEHTTVDGTIQARSVETKHSLVDLARKNPSFSVDGVRAERKLGTSKLPTDNDQYRGYALVWIRDSTTLTALDIRWAAEAALREKCGCDAKDENYIRPFLEARRDQLKDL